MSKSKVISLSSTPESHNHDTYVILIDGKANSVWDDLDEAQNEVERLDGLKNKNVVLFKLKKNISYPSPMERKRSVVMTAPGVFVDSDGVAYESENGQVGVTRIN